MVYVLHANWFFWTLYHALLRPFLAVTSRKGYQRLVLVQTAVELGPYFDTDQLTMLDDAQSSGLPLPAQSSSSPSTVPTTELRQ